MKDLGTGFLIWRVGPMAQVPYLGRGHKNQKRQVTMQDYLYGVARPCSTNDCILWHLLVLFRAGLGICIEILIAKIYVEPQHERSKAC